MNQPIDFIISALSVICFYIWCYNVGLNQRGHKPVPKPNQL